MLASVSRVVLRPSAIGELQYVFSEVCLIFSLPGVITSDSALGHSKTCGENRSGSAHQVTGASRHHFSRNNISTQALTVGKLILGDLGEYFSFMRGAVSGLLCNFMHQRSVCLVFLLPGISGMKGIRSSDDVSVNFLRFSGCLCVPPRGAE